MSKRKVQKQQTQYIVVTGCSSSLTGKRYDAGEMVKAEYFVGGDKDIEWLIGKGAIKVKDDGGQASDAARD
jgi:hypothetical protein